MAAKDTRFAIAVRDGKDLWLFLWLKRDATGDVYVFWPIDEKGRNPHASYHASGRSHQKSYNKALTRLIMLMLIHVRRLRGAPARRSCGRA
jgi:hypothetical protein